MQECGLKGLQWKRVVIDGSGECVNINCGLNIRNERKNHHVDEHW